MICKTCKFGKFDEQWGEYKCTLRQIRVNDEITECKFYKPKKIKKEDKKK